ncbi:MAG: hypothetical protein Q8Q23_03145 [bacterium]|nr:hypothetical protein [bacterium]
MGIENFPQPLNNNENKKEKDIKAGDGVIAEDRIFYKVLEINEDGVARLEGKPGEEVTKHISELQKFDTYQRPEGKKEANEKVKVGDGVIVDRILYLVRSVNDDGTLELEGKPGQILTKHISEIKDVLSGLEKTQERASIIRYFREKNYSLNVKKGDSVIPITDDNNFGVLFLVMKVDDDSGMVKLGAGEGSKFKSIQVSKSKLVRPDDFQIAYLDQFQKNGVNILLGESENEKKEE